MYLFVEIDVLDNTIIGKIVKGRLPYIFIYFSDLSSDVDTTIELKLRPV